MKPTGRLFLRVGVSVAVLATLIVCISPASMLKAVVACDGRWLMAALLLAPVFLAIRVTKWYVLVRQTAPQASPELVFRGYLWGMAVGLITPGRVGELARIWGAGLPLRCTGLFLLEKLLEINAVIWLCLLSLSTLDLLPFWVLGGVALILVLFMVSWRRGIHKTSQLSHRIFGWPSKDKLQAFSTGISSVRVMGCAFLSLLCPLVFCLQSYLLLNSMGENCGLLVIRYVPIVFLANLIPVTIGGLGVREAIAVYLFSNDGISAAVVMTSFVLVAAMDLFLPAALGAVLNSLRPNIPVGAADQPLCCRSSKRSAGPPPENQIPIPQCHLEPGHTESESG